MSTPTHTAVKAYHKVCKSDLRDRLILEHLYFVRHILGKMLGGLPDSVDHDNLESAGILGLVEAAGQFDPSRGIAFTTFAYQRIRGAILDELRRNCPVPQAVLQNWTLIREASVHMMPPLTSEKLADQTGLTVEDIDACIAAMRLTRPESWADESGEMPVPDNREDDVDADSRRLEEKQLLADAIEELPQRMRLAVTMYYLEDMRMKEIGEVLNLSESRVSRLIGAAELQLKSTMKRRSGESS
jgi:RNA polymerase sigma factor for flagellar operon FliA